MVRISIARAWKEQRLNPSLTAGSRAGIVRVVGVDIERVGATAVAYAAAGLNYRFRSASSHAAAGLGAVPPEASVPPEAIGGPRTSVSPTST